MAVQSRQTKDRTEILDSMANNLSMSRSEFTNFLVYGLASIPDDDISKIVARGQLVDIAITSGDAVNDNGQIELDVNSRFYPLIMDVDES